MFGIKQKTEEWYNVRKKIITATDVAIILECNPYMKKSELLYNKINDITTVENNIIKWGEEYEDIIAEFYSKIKKVKVDKIGLIIHNDYKWLGASPDGIINNNKLLNRNGIIILHRNRKSIDNFNDFSGTWEGGN